MNRMMIDFTHDHVDEVLPMLPSYDLAAIYGTGSSDIQETAVDIAKIRATPFGNRPLVMIDQGFTGSPQPLDTVRDIEPGAWLAAAAVNLDGWDAQRPTQYCSRDVIPDLIALGWHGDIWLADPGYSGSTPPIVAAGMTVVAVQHTSTLIADISTVYDPYWPFPSPFLPVNPQPGWRWCRRCEGLFWGGGAAKSVCPAGGTHMITSGSYIYSLPWKV